VGRALDELGIRSIAARSPQAKGRIERLWGTFQDRLVTELRLAGAQDRWSPVQQRAFPPSGGDIQGRLTRETHLPRAEGS